jgi:AraC-like DNA-binding protein
MPGNTRNNQGQKSSARLVDKKAAPVLLWIDMTVTSRKTRLPKCFVESCEIRRSDGFRISPRSSEAAKPSILCFDFDYPDIRGLRFLIATKRRYPSYPILMLTEQHSEDLAVWAFRERVSDYLVKPISELQAERTLDALTRVLPSLSFGTSHRVEMPIVPLPLEGRFQARNNQQMALRPAINHVEAHFRKKINAGKVANLCGMSPSYFSRAFKAAYGITFQEFLMQLRTSEACRLLNNPNASVTDVAYTVGFNDVSYFGRMFKRYYKVNPSDYRQIIAARRSAEDSDTEPPNLHAPDLLVGIQSVLARGAVR